ncbi:MAG: N4-gp56 family major capsid protein [Rubrivivax sp.]|nr:MAG: N4-gp56 family major capsid protein [Rubrivivax sp.]
MARTTILPSNPNKRKAWAASVALDSINEQYFSRLIGAEGTPSVVTKKTETEKGMGDEVTTALVAKLRGDPITEGKKLAGSEFKLSHSAHTMRINEFRHGVNVGARIEQSRVGFNLKQQGRAKLKDYIKALYEERIHVHAAGARGVADDFDTILDLGYTGYPNALRAPDAAHLFVGQAGNKEKNTLVATDLMRLTTINKLRTKVKKMKGGAPSKAIKISPTVKGGKECYIVAVPAEVMQDIREDVGSQGWFEAQKALITAIGKDAEAFKGGAGMWNGMLVDETDLGVYFDDYGATSNVKAARSLVLGANAISIAHGTKGQADGMTVALDEDTDDRGHDNILFFEMIFGADKTAYEGMDYGMITVDTAYTESV